MALGKDPLNWINEKSNNVKEDKSIKVNTAKSKNAKVSDKKKVTYYVDPKLDKALKMLAIEKEMKISDLVDEAIEMYIRENAKEDEQ